MAGVSVGELELEEGGAGERVAANLTAGDIGLKLTDLLLPSNLTTRASNSLSMAEIGLLALTEALVTMESKLLASSTIEMTGGAGVGNSSILVRKCVHIY